MEEESQSDVTVASRGFQPMPYVIVELSVRDAGDTDHWLPADPSCSDCTAVEHNSIEWVSVSIPTRTLAGSAMNHTRITLKPASNPLCIPFVYSSTPLRIHTRQFTMAHPCK